MPISQGMFGSNHEKDRGHVIEMSNQNGDLTSPGQQSNDVIIWTMSTADFPSNLDNINLYLKQKSIQAVNVWS